MKKYYSLIDKVYQMKNLREAYYAVKSNKGKPGVDGETLEDYGRNIEENLDNLHHELRTGTYKPSPVRRVNIPKPDGSTRPLGIPTVKDRVCQQAVLNKLQPIFDPNFHPSSYGYRPNCSCHKAVAKAEQFINKYNFRYVVDMDLSKCFDRLDHDLIIQEVAKRISDGSLLKLIRKFLKAGVIEDGAIEETELGSPQGGVISPLLTNIYLDYFDQKMMDKGIRIVRDADDILIFGKTPRQANKYYDIAKEILEVELKLTVNKDKTHITTVKQGVPYLGFIIREKVVSVHPDKIKEIKDKIRELTPRNHGMNLKEMIKKLNPVLRGWANYFRIANCKKLFKHLMSWIRRRLRMKNMKEWKTWRQLHKTLRRQGYQGEFMKIAMNKWRNSSSPLISYALPNEWFQKHGLVDISTYNVGILYHFKE